MYEHTHCFSLSPLPRRSLFSLRAFSRGIARYRRLRMLWGAWTRWLAFVSESFAARAFKAGEEAARRVALRNQFSTLWAQPERYRPIRASTGPPLLPAAASPPASPDGRSGSPIEVHPKRLVRSLEAHGGSRESLLFR